MKKIREAALEYSNLPENEDEPISSGVAFALGAQDALNGAGEIDTLVNARKWIDKQDSVAYDEHREERIGRLVKHWQNGYNRFV